MTATTGPHSVALPAPGRAWIRKAVQDLSRWHATRRMRRDLIRIAETAPHLLPDAGFEPQETPDKQTRNWHREGVCVTLCHNDQRSPRITVTLASPR